MGLPEDRQSSTTVTEDRLDHLWMVAEQLDCASTWRVVRGATDALADGRWWDHEDLLDTIDPPTWEVLADAWERSVDDPFAEEPQPLLELMSEAA